MLVFWSKLYIKNYTRYIWFGTLLHVICRQRHICQNAHMGKGNLMQLHPCCMAMWHVHMQCVKQPLCLAAEPSSATQKHLREISMHTSILFSLPHFRAPWDGESLQASLLACFLKRHTIVAKIVHANEAPTASAARWAWVIREDSAVAKSKLFKESSCLFLLGSGGGRESLPLLFTVILSFVLPTPKTTHLQCNDKWHLTRSDPPFLLTQEAVLCWELKVHWRCH